MTVLLGFPEFSEHINDDLFIYEDPSCNCYSPISYAGTFYKGPFQEQKKLQKLLKDKNCRPILYNRHGNHPPNFTYHALPQHLKQAVDAEALVNRQHAEALRRRKEVAQIDQEIGDRQHQRTLAQAQQLEAHEIQASQQRHNMELSRKHELGRVEVQTMRDRQALEMQHQANMSTQRQQIEDRDRTREYAHIKQINQLEHDKEQKRLGGQRQLLLEQDRVHANQHGRHLQMLDKQDQSVRFRAEKLKEVAAAARGANAIAGPGGQQRPLQLGFGEDWATVD